MKSVTDTLSEHEMNVVHAALVAYKESSRLEDGRARSLPARLEIMLREADIVQVIRVEK